MTARSIRRAAEREALKSARKGAAPIPTTAASFITPAQTLTQPTTEAQLTANRANAALSTGPTSDAGKAISSKNALKTALTGRTVLLPTDDLAAYQSLLDTYATDYQPANQEERELVQSLADTGWRLRRIMNLEFAIFTKGSLEFADQFPDLDFTARAQMIQVETFLKYEKSLRNLNTQEGRLRRQLVKDTAALQTLQAERIQLQAEMASFVAAHTAKQAAPASRTEIGFEFSDSPDTPGSTPQLAAFELAAASCISKQRGSGKE